jgi:hypothetical protein
MLPAARPSISSPPSASIFRPRPRDVSRASRWEVKPLLPANGGRVDIHLALLDRIDEEPALGGDAHVEAYVGTGLADAASRDKREAGAGVLYSRVLVECREPLFEFGGRGDVLLGCRAAFWFW